MKRCSNHKKSYRHSFQQKKKKAHFKFAHLYQDKMEPEIHWRLARIKYELAKKASNGTEKGKMLEEAFQLVTTALEMDEGNFAIHKWKAILLNEVSILRGLKEQISQSMNVKQHIKVNE